ncbi:MAG: PHP domain-containing protein [Erysipelotrichaceae bacterium]|nr:PHP domain-containing protein [Erysipelotrichaceae bacterium]
MPIFSTNELKRAQRIKEEELYESEGHKKAVYLSRQGSDYINHLYAFLIDLNICLVPVYLWGVEFILILSGIIPPAYFDLLFYVMYGLLFLTSCIWLPLYTAAKHGVTVGGRLLGVRLVKEKGKRVPSAMQLVMRQLFGFGLPMMIFGFFFSVWGILAWWLVDALVALISPHQKTIFDWIFGLCFVYPPQYEMKVVEQDENQQEQFESFEENQEEYQEGMLESAFVEESSKQEETPIASTPQAERTSTLNKFKQKREAKKKSKASQKEKTTEVQDELAAAAAASVALEATPKEEKLEISKYDLHIRSNFSDDSDAEVEDIFQQAKALNLDVISITDHNNARANAIANHFAKLYDIKYIPGVEIDCQQFGQRVRILGYYIDWNDPFFDGIERLSLKREKDLSLARIEAFERLAGLKVDTDTLLANSRFKVLTAKQLVDLVFDTPEARQVPLVKKYIDQYPSEQEAREACIQECFGKGGPCEVPAEYPSATKVIEAIHKAGGMAILAGWHISQLSNETIDTILDHGIDGFEAFVPNNSKREQAFLISLATEEKVFITSGSDYHGTRIPERHLGVTGASAKADQIVSVFTSALN